MTFSHFYYQLSYINLIFIKKILGYLILVPPKTDNPIYYQFSDTKVQNPVSCYSRFPIPYHHPSSRRFPVFAVKLLLNVVWYSGTRTVTSRTKDVRLGNITLNIRAFSAHPNKIQQNLDGKTYTHNENIITVVT